MSADKDVTAQVQFGSPDDESLPLMRCVCGKRFPAWQFIVSIDPDLSRACECGRRFYFTSRITVFEVGA